MAFSPEQFFEPAPETIEVDIRGTRLTFRPTHGFDEYLRLSNMAERMAKVWTNPGLCLGELKGLALADPDAAKLCYTLAELSVEPKLSHVDMLKLCKHAPSAFTSIVAQVSQRITSASSRNIEEDIEERKKP